MIDFSARKWEDFQYKQIYQQVLEKYSIMSELDEKDEQILELLMKDGRMTTGAISKELGMPQTTVHNRIKRMKDNGIIKRFTIEVDGKKTGKGLVAYILCTVSYNSGKGQKIDQYEVAKQIDSLPEVERVSIVTGEIDLILRVALRDVDALNDFVVSKLRNITGIQRTVTSVVLSEV